MAAELSQSFAFGKMRQFSYSTSRYPTCKDMSSWSDDVAKPAKEFSILVGHGLVKKGKANDRETKMKRYLSSRGYCSNRNFCSNLSESSKTALYIFAIVFASITGL